MNANLDLDQWMSQFYEPDVLALPHCDDSWFADSVAKARQGDREARGKLLGSCLRIPLRIAQRKWTASLGVHLLNLVEEGNRALDEALRSFQDVGAQEFLGHAERVVEQRIDRLIALIREHPDTFTPKWK